MTASTRKHNGKIVSLNFYLAILRAIYCSREEHFAILKDEAR